MFAEIKKKVRISGVGCCLVDVLYTDINFKSERFTKYLSRSQGDGGLVPGQLVFAEELERYAGEDLNNIIENIRDENKPAKTNIGGPAIVALINASQILDQDQFQIDFYGKYGPDHNGAFLIKELQKNCINLSSLKQSHSPTPNTVVLSDPAFDHGAGERTFVNSIGAACELLPKDLDENFYSSDFVLFGATALTPNIHDELGFILKKAKERKCTTIVTTVYDFRNEKAAPNQKWPLGQSDESYKFIDLLIMDRIEAQRLSGARDIENVTDFFKSSGCSSFIITNGSKDITAYSDGRLFQKVDLLSLPVSGEVGVALQDFKEGDTTGCGDNFAGGVIASLVNQSTLKKPDLIEACSWGVVSGGFSCFYVGGTYSENYQGEKLEKLSQLYNSYREQIKNSI